MKAARVISELLGQRDDSFTQPAYCGVGACSQAASVHLMLAKQHRCTDVAMKFFSQLHLLFCLCECRGICGCLLECHWILCVALMGRRPSCHAKGSVHQIALLIFLLYAHHVKHSEIVHDDAVRVLSCKKNRTSNLKTPRSIFSNQTSV